MSLLDCLPIGYKFNPTDQVLLEHYLFNKFHGFSYCTDTIFDCDLYGSDEPWQIWEYFGGVDDKDLYFFTKLKRSTNQSGQFSAHVNRKIGSAGGCWSGENSATPIFATGRDDQILGYCKRFRYENKECSEHNGEWIMHEYSLHPDLINNCSNFDYVLCQIRKNIKSKGKAAKGSVSTIQFTQRRVIAPQNNEIRKNERPTKRAKKIVEQKDMTPQTIYNMPCEPKMTTDQGTSGGAIILWDSETITDQCTNDETNFLALETIIDQGLSGEAILWASETITDQGTSDEANLLALETITDQGTYDEGNLGHEVLNMHQGTNNENNNDDDEYELWLSNILTIDDQGTSDDAL